jgi:hypothetical protein
MRGSTALATLLICLLPGTLRAESTPRLASYDWSVKASPNLASKPPSMKILVDFLNSVLESAGESDPDIGENNPDSESAQYVCSFRFTDLRRNGSLSLVAGLGVPQRPSCRDVYIIDKTAAGFEVYTSGGSIGDGEDVSASLKDLRHDGNLEFLLFNPLGEIKDQCAAGFTAIYSWTGGGYTNVSQRFKDFYLKRLETINKVVPTLQPCCVSQGYSLNDKECLEAEAAKIQRFLGVSKEADMNQAIRLANSKDPAERGFATELLGEISGPKAQKYLETLAKDSDGSVASSAKYSLAAVAKGGISGAPDSFELLKQDPVLKH